MNRKERLRPCPAGVSVGHYQISAGTLGCWIKKDSKWYALSNNHVLANCNQGQIGDSIWQPGRADNGTAEDEIGKLYKFIPLSFTETSETLNLPAKFLNFIFRLFRLRTQLLVYKLGKPNKVDCALAKPNDDADILAGILDDKEGLVQINGEAEPQIGMKVKKSGRTTGTSRGIITQTDVAVNVGMGEGRTALFTDQFIIENKMSAGGDSGSLITTLDNKAVGLLFAGSETHTIANKFSAVKERLGIE